MPNNYDTIYVQSVDVADAHTKNSAASFEW